MEHAGSRRRVWALSIAALLVAGAASALVLILTTGPTGPATTPEEEALPSVLRYEQDGLRYTYHVLTGQEALFDSTADPRELRNLLRERGEDASRLRRSLEQELKIESLDSLRDRRKEEIEQLKALGYL